MENVWVVSLYDEDGDSYVVAVTRTMEKAREIAMERITRYYNSNAYPSDRIIVEDGMSVKLKFNITDLAYDAVVVWWRRMEVQ